MRSLRNLVWVPVLALFLVPALAQAQTVGFDQGEWTLRLSGSGSSTNDFDSTSVGASARVGYFVTDDIAIEVGQSLSISSVEDGDDDWAGSTSVGAAYYFDLDRWQPFLGADIGYIYGDATDDQFIADLRGGVTYFVNTTTYIYGEVAYEWLTEDSFSDDGRWVYTVGIGFTF